MLNLKCESVSVALKDSDLSQLAGVVAEMAQEKLVKQLLQGLLQKPAPVLETRTLLDGKSVDFDKAMEAIKELGEGWRMATVDDAIPMIDRSRHNPAVDPEKYPDILPKFYWTSTPCAWNEESAVWVVFFNYGSVVNYPRDLDACVLAVRSSQ